MGVNIHLLRPACPSEVLPAPAASSSISLYSATASSSCAWNIKASETPVRLSLCGLCVCVCVIWVGFFCSPRPADHHSAAVLCGRTLPELHSLLPGDGLCVQQTGACHWQLAAGCESWRTWANGFPICGVNQCTAFLNQPFLGVSPPKAAPA